MKILNTILATTLATCLTACSTSNWRTANRDSAGIAPLPETLDESIFQIYTARAFSWRGYFATHPWVAWKKKNDRQYTISQVTAWGAYHGQSAVWTGNEVPDRNWFGSQPKILIDIRGERADRIIDQVINLIDNYKYKNSYRLWPGPNSNTFVEHIIRYTPELTVELPPESIGKDFLTNGSLFARSPGGKGFQFSLFGLAGFSLGLSEGIEINILGAVFGVDILSPALKLPIVGRIGMKDRQL